MSSIRGISVLVLGWVVLSFGCASRGVIPEAGPLPFHVAVVPVESHRITVDQSRDADLEFSLTIDESTMSEGLCRELRKQSFFRATLLEYPSDVDRETFVGLDSSERHRWWVQSASEVKADLVLVPHLEYKPRIDGESGPWYTAVPSLLFLGPFQFLIRDRAYTGEAHLTVSIHDLNTIEDAQATLANNRGRITRAESEFTETKMKFFDRASGVLSYAQTLVVPSGWLAKKTKAAQEQMVRDVVATLSDGVARELGVAQKQDILIAAESANHFVEPESVRLVRTEGEGVLFEGTVILNTGRGVDRLKDYEIAVGGEILRGVFEAPEVDETRLGTEEFLRYQIREPVPESMAHASSLRLIVREGGAPPRRRSYTFPMRSDSDPVR